MRRPELVLLLLSLCHCEHEQPPDKPQKPTLPALQSGVYRAPPSWPERAWQLHRTNVPGIDRIDPGYLDLDAQKSSWKVLLDIYAKVIPLDNGSIRTAIDVGSGVGGFASAATERGIVTLNLDVISFGVPYLHLVAERGFLGIEHDARDPLPLVDRAVDLVHCNDVFHAFQPPELGGILREWDRVLRPGGWVIIYFHGFLGSDPTSSLCRSRVNAVQMTAKQLQWKTVNEKEWIAPTTDEPTIRLYFQKPL